MYIHTHTISGLILGLVRPPGEGNGNLVCILLWEIAWTEEPDKLHSIGSQWLDTTLLLNNNMYYFTFIYIYMFIYVYVSLLLGKIEGKLRRRQRMSWLDSITDSRNINLGKLREMVREREAWHAAVHGITESDMTQ